MSEKVNHKQWCVSLCVAPPFPVKDMYDYQGRSYLHVPQDVGINLRTADVPDKCYLPKKQIHVWTGHTKVSGGGAAVWVHTTRALHPASTTWELSRSQAVEGAQWRRAAEAYTNA